MKKIKLPFSEEDIRDLEVGDMLLLSGKIFTGRDAAIPKLAKIIRTNKIDTSQLELTGSVVFHTAVSNAGIGPTSSNKFEIESNMEVLSSAGVKMHLGKGRLSDNTVSTLNHNNSVYAIIPPVTALLESKIKSKRVVAFEEEGIEALHELIVIDFPAIVVIAHGRRLI
ncbi:L(+)-tartrate dehydratase subunit beta [Candidatus Izimaplasma bacterium HR1]|jgi:fumarate hydratase subunit beta|uniref:fumarate hydratase C-terminal domain-containing protein n=1 Tax=Candidatus Izimoplasma sp. HR1 TaxID=1541959 RepID=UPI0004F6D3C9|nr:L(+)-tartrate dehydratase subunit beta [Candidatus Izimaplasma bacterium HR1]